MLAVSLDSYLGRGGRRGEKMPCLFRVQERRHGQPRAGEKCIRRVCSTFFFWHTKWRERHKAGRKTSYTSELEFRKAGRVGSEEL